MNVTVRSGCRKSGDQLQITFAVVASGVVAVVVSRTGVGRRRVRRLAPGVAVRSDPRVGPRDLDRGVDRAVRGVDTVPLLAKPPRAAHARVGEVRSAPITSAKKTRNPSAREQHLPTLVTRPHDTILLMTCTVSVASPSVDVARIVIRCIPLSEWAGADERGAVRHHSRDPRPSQYSTLVIATEKPPGTESPDNAYGPARAVVEYGLRTLSFTPSPANAQLCPPCLLPLKPGDSDRCDEPAQDRAEPMTFPDDPDRDQYLRQREPP